MQAARNLALHARLEALIEAAIDLLDELDGDADLEVETGLDADAAPLRLNPERMRSAKRARQSFATARGALRVNRAERQACATLLFVAQPCSMVC